MLVTLNIKDESRKDKFLNFIKTLDYIDIAQKQEDHIKVKNDKFKEFAGLWKDRDIDIKTIRESAWKK